MIILFITEQELGDTIKHTRSKYITYRTTINLAELLQLGLVRARKNNNLFLATAEAAEICRLADLGVLQCTPNMGRFAHVIVVLGRESILVGPEDLYKSAKLYLVRDGITKWYWQ